MPALEKLTAADVLLVVLFGAFAAWAWGRGVPRRILSIWATLVAVVVAAQFRNPIGQYLGANWTDTPRAYGTMVAFSIVLFVFFAAIAIFVEWRMTAYELFRRRPRLEGLLGSTLAIVQGFVLLGAIALTIDPYFEGDGAGPAVGGEFGPYRGVWVAFRGSLAMGLVRDSVLPVLIEPVRNFLPADLADAFPRASASPEPTPSASPSGESSPGPSAPG